MVLPAQFHPNVLLGMPEPLYDPLNDPTTLEFRVRFQYGGINPHPWTPDLLIDAARETEKHESPLTRIRFEAITGITRKLVRQHFAGGWEELVDRSGIDGCIVRRRFWTDDSLLREYDRVVRLLGRIPTQLEFEARSETTRQNLALRFGNKAAVVDRYTRWLQENDLDFPTRPESFPPRYPDEVVKGTWTRERLIAAARTADRASPEPLSLPRFCEAAEVSNFTVYRLFPSGWTDLVQTAGIRVNATARRYTDDELLHLYHDLQQRLGHHPTANQLRRLLPVSNTTYRNRFGNMGELRQRYDEWAAAQ